MAKERSVNLTTLHSHLLKGMTMEEIGRLMRVKPRTITKIANKHFPHLRELPLYKKHKVDVFRSVQQYAISHIIKRIPRAKIKDLTKLVAMLEHNINIREGRATSNLGIGMRVEGLIVERDNLADSLKGQGLNGLQLDKAVQDKLALPPGASLPMGEIIDAVTSSSEPEEVTM